jgi:hypothetical protein
VCNPRNALACRSIVMIHPSSLDQSPSGNAGKG